MIPHHTKEALINWAKIGNQYNHGSFLTALVSNKLMESFSHADQVNLYSMLEIVKWIYLNLPVCCYGSVEKAESWKGMKEEEFESWTKTIDKKG